MKKNIKSKALLTVLALTLNTSVVFADSKIVHTDMMKYDKNNTVVVDSSIMGIGEGYDIVKRNPTGSNMWFITLETSENGTFEPVYCLDFGATLKSKITLTTTKDLATYLKNESLANKIQEYMYFGYGSNANRKNAIYYIATQTLIWKALNDANIENKELTTFANGGYEYGFANTTSANTTLNSKINDAMQAILTDIKNYSVIPSFCNSSEKLEIAVDETATFEDKNKVLANYTINCSEGIKCETNGNELKVTALSENKAQTITFTKSGGSNGKSLVYEGEYEGEKQQAVATSVGKIAPVSCEFGVDTYKPVQTSDAKIVMIIMVTFMCGALAYVAYYTKKSLNEVK